MNGNAHVNSLGSGEGKPVLQHTASDRTVVALAVYSCGLWTGNPILSVPKLADGIPMDVAQAILTGSRFVQHAPPNDLVNRPSPHHPDVSPSPAAEDGTRGYTAEPLRGF